MLTTHSLSKNIRIFPYSKDRVTDPFGRHINERNLIDLVKHSTNYDSFVIDCQNISTGTLKDPSKVSKLVEFQIGGYYVNFTLEFDLTNNEEVQFWLCSHVYAEISLYDASSDETVIDAEGNTTSDSISVAYQELYGADNEDVNNLYKFTGVKFISYSDEEYAELDDNKKAVRYCVQESVGEGDPVHTVIGLKLFNTCLEEYDVNTNTVNLHELDMTRYVPYKTWVRFNTNTQPLGWSSFSWNNS